MPVDAHIRRMVRDRANNRCEYCQIHQDQLPFVRFHIEHIIPRQHGGSDEISNLALGCHWCNFNKGTNLATLVDGLLTPLYNPRAQTWQEHFRIQGLLITGLTPVGRGTVQLLDMNDEDRQEIRAESQG